MCNKRESTFDERHNVIYFYCNLLKSKIHDNDNSKNSLFLLCILQIFDDLSCGKLFETWFDLTYIIRWITTLIVYFIKSNIPTSCTFTCTALSCSFHHLLRTARESFPILLISNWSCNFTCTAISCSSNAFSSSLLHHLFRTVRESLLILFTSNFNGCL